MVNQMTGTTVVDVLNWSIFFMGMAFRKHECKYVNRCGGMCAVASAIPVLAGRGGGGGGGGCLCNEKNICRVPSPIVSPQRA